MNNRLFLISSVCALLAVACGGASDDESQANQTAAQDLSRRVAVKVTRTDLVSDRPGAVTLDPHLVNPWGLAFNPAGPAWVSNAETASSTVYDANGKLLLTVDIPAAPGATEGAAPTGQVFNGTSGFAGDKFIFADEHGSIVGWQPATGAKTRADHSAKHAIYKGLAIAGSYLYATDFHNGVIDVFTPSYWTNPSEGGFVDPTIPAGYAPFNVQEIGGKLFVTYAQQDADKEDDVKGAGKGFVNVFTTNGRLIGRVASGGVLNAPWGLAVAPPSFGPLAGKLLVGNFGDGKVNAFDVSFVTTYGHGPDGPPPSTSVRSTSVGPVLDTTGQALAIDGLWALAVSPSGGLFFTAGPEGETHGVFGKLSLAPYAQ